MERRNMETDRYLESLRLKPFVANYNQVPMTWKQKAEIADVNKIYLIEDGEGIIRINDLVLHAKPGDMVFIPQGAKHSYSIISAKTYTKYWVHFSATVGIKQLSEVLLFPVMGRVRKPQIKEIFTQLVTAMNDHEPSSSLRATGLLYELVSMYFSHVCDHDLKLKNNSETNPLMNVLDYMNQHMNEKIRIDDLSEQVGYHPNYLIKIFTKNFGVSPIEYLNRQRMNMAKDLLRNPYRSIKSVAYELGFTTPYYFSKVFKKQFGVCPQEYRTVVLTKTDDDLSFDYLTVSG